MHLQFTAVPTTPYSPRPAHSAHWLHLSEPFGRLSSELLDENLESFEVESWNRKGES